MLAARPMEMLHFHLLLISGLWLVLLNGCCGSGVAGAVQDEAKQSVHPLHHGDGSHVLCIMKKKKSPVTKIARGDVTYNYHNASGMKNHWGYQVIFNLTLFFFFFFSLNPRFSNWKRLLPE